jgi:hypothetical protein
MLKEKCRRTCNSLIVCDLKQISHACFVHIVGLQYVFLGCAAGDVLRDNSTEMRQRMHTLL